MKSQKNKTWKVIPCHSGTECWCRIIVVDDLIRSDEGDPNINNSGSISKEFAEYIVDLHNKNLNESTDLRFNTNAELFDFLQVNFEGRTLINNDVCNIEDFTDNEIEKEVKARRYYYFEDESDIQDYVEDSMNLYVFDYE